MASAGNEGEDACNWSPGSALAVLTAGATNETGDVAAFYSNYGPCVKIVGCTAGGGEVFARLTIKWIGFAVGARLRRPFDPSKRDGRRENRDLVCEPDRRGGERAARDRSRMFDLTKGRTALADGGALLVPAPLHQPQRNWTGGHERIGRRLECSPPLPGC